MTPVLHSDRFTLRPYRRSDFDAYAAFMASDRAAHMDGPLDRDRAWTWFTNDVATWALYGFGTLAIEVDGQFAGGVGLVYPPHFPEPECGWFVCDGFTGQGFAVEAGRMMLDYTFANTDLTTVVSYISEGNTASLRVAETLGAIRDPSAARPPADDCLVYRHTHPGHRSVS